MGDKQPYERRWNLEWLKTALFPSQRGTGSNVTDSEVNEKRQNQIEGLKKSKEAQSKLWNRWGGEAWLDKMFPGKTGKEPQKKYRETWPVTVTQSTNKSQQDKWNKETEEKIRLSQGYKNYLEKYKKKDNPSLRWMFWKTHPLKDYATPAKETDNELKKYLENWNKKYTEEWGK